MKDFLVRHKIECNNYDDIFMAIGRIIQAAQEWEKQYKSYVKLIGFEIKNIDKATLNKINKCLYENQIISKKEYEDLDMVIQERNYINHEFFLDESYLTERTENSYIIDMQAISCRLENIYNYIFEATDVITNLIAKFRNDPIRCPTIFDED